MHGINLNNNQKISANEFLLAILICANSINWILKIDNGLAIYVIISFFALLMLNMKKLISSLNITSVIFIFYIYTFFGASIIYSDNTEQTYIYLQLFTILGVIPILVSSLNFNTEKTLKYIFFIGLLFLPFIFTFDSVTYESIREVDGGGGIMGLSYGLLVYCTAILIIIFLFKKQPTIKKILLYIQLSGILFFLLSYGSRGTLVALSMLIVVLFVLRKNNNKYVRNLVFTSILLLMFIWFFVLVIYPLLETYKINFRFIEKFLRLSDEGDISNGRNILYRFTVDSIIDQPIVGHFIGNFKHAISNYPHNFILQFLYEGGVLLGVPIIYLVVKSIIIMFSKKYDFNFRILIVFLFFSSVIGLMFSSYPWISQVFWLLIGNVLHRKNHIVSTERLAQNGKIKYNYN